MRHYLLDQYKNNKNHIEKKKIFNYQMQTMNIKRIFQWKNTISPYSHSRTILFPSYRCACYAVHSLPCIHKRNQITPLFFLGDTERGRKREREREKAQKSEHDDESMHKKRKTKQPIMTTTIITVFFLLDKCFGINMI
jgi:hypothetical protein